MAKTLAQGRKPGSGRKPGKGKTLAEGRKPGSGRKKGSSSKKLDDGRKPGSGRRKLDKDLISKDLENSQNNNGSVQIYPNIASKDTLIKSASPDAVLLQAAANAQYQQNQLDSQLPYTHDQQQHNQPVEDHHHHSLHLGQQLGQHQPLSHEQVSQYAAQALENDQNNATVQVRYSDLQKLLMHTNTRFTDNQRIVFSLEPEHQVEQQQQQK